MLDPEDELFDRKLANHLVSLYYKSSEQEEQEMLVSRLSYLKQHSNCILLFQLLLLLGHIVCIA